ncbi:2-methylcitrate dehydratase [Helicobacter heilmannii]|uniref:bifunctional 2-methylcitrate dehydratase/aconitate hydratase n=1 Tax=Helicobacter heilmannii TaxID=35817 RepID=UPI0006A1103C|nr:bifunctional 2-methylcitrate dehydratase/aconitate hydratase [Helicobacter heilmannii]CRF51406.1 2-methylcitrate dehydratase [Helicobacter heilmannii]
MLSYDSALTTLGHYILDGEIPKHATQSATLSLIDSIACALMALKDPECTKFLGPSVPGADFRPLGAKVLGTAYQLEPVVAAFNVSCMVRWMDFNDTWLAKEWCHPSDNLGAIWALGDYVSRLHLSQQEEPLKVRDILHAMVQAYEIQGVLAMDNSFYDEGLDHTLLVRVASAGVGAKMLGGGLEEILSALSHAFVDGGVLRVFRHAPFSTTRQAWAGADATSRGVQLALRAMSGEMGCMKALSAPKWGFEAVFMPDIKGGLVLNELGTHVIENVLYKISYPALFPIQTAIECALILHKQIAPRLDEISKIVLTTQEGVEKIMAGGGQAYQRLDREYSLAYPIAYALLRGHLRADSYSDTNAKNPFLQQLMDLIEVQISPLYTKEAKEPHKRAIANALQVFFKDGSSTQKVEVKYPLGHRFRREEGLSALQHKCQNALKEVYPRKKAAQIETLLADQDRLEKMDFNRFCDLLSFV